MIIFTYSRAKKARDSNIFVVIQTYVLPLLKISQLTEAAVQVFLGKRVPKISSKFKGEPQCRSVLSIKLHATLIEISLQHGYSPTNVLHIFGTSGGLLLYSKKRFERPFFSLCSI